MRRHTCTAVSGYTVVAAIGWVHFRTASACASGSSVGRAVDCSGLSQVSIGRWFKSGPEEFSHSLIHLTLGSHTANVMDVKRRSGP